MEMKRYGFKIFSILMVLGILLSACATPTPQTTIQTVEVEKKVVETQVVTVKKTPDCSGHPD
jgi:hypothetical protein